MDRPRPPVACGRRRVSRWRRRRRDSASGQLSRPVGADALAQTRFGGRSDQRGTLSETLACWQAAQDEGYAGIVSARSGETEDTTIVHLAVGWSVGQLKVGSFARGERMAKWNEALRIEERLGGAARFAGAATLGRTRRS